MPGFDRSGPGGQGPMTGWQGGACRRMDSQGGGSAMGRGRGGGRCGFAGMANKPGNFAGGASRNASNLQEDPQSLLASLKQQQQAAEEMLRSLADKIAALESGRRI